VIVDFAPLSPHAHPDLGNILILAIGSNWLDVKLATGETTTISKQRAVAPDPEWPPEKLKAIAQTILSCKTMDEVRRRLPALDADSRQRRRKALECHQPEAFAHVRQLGGRPLSEVQPPAMGESWRSPESQRLYEALVADGCTEGIPIEAIALALAAAA
jgi:hypothetical protein